MMRPLVVGGPLLAGPLDVQPPSVSISGWTGGVVAFTITGGATPYAVTTSNAAFAPVLTPTGFTVNVKNNTAPATVNFTVTDSSVPAVSVTVKMSII